MPKRTSRIPPKPVRRLTDADVTELCARAAHEVNRVYCDALGDYSQFEWTGSPEWQKESSRVGVEKAILGATPKQLHESWMKQKLDEGWVYGDVKDATAKTHPCLVAYKELPAQQKMKDTLFQTIVKAMYLAIKDI